jgi:hypothetical protein
VTQAAGARAPLRAARYGTSLAGIVFDARDCGAPRRAAAEQFGSPENVFHARLRRLGGCELPAPTAQAILKKEAFKRTEKELVAVRAIPGCQLVNELE